MEIIILVAVAIFIFISCLVIKSYANNATRYFKDINDEWKKELLKSPTTTEVVWTSTKPVLINKDIFPLIFKEVTIKGNLHKDGEDSKFEATGYAVAIKMKDDWTPTKMFILAECSDDAFKEYIKIREKN